MIDQGKQFTVETLRNSPFVAKGKSRAQALAKGLADISTGLSFDHVSETDFNIHAVKDPNKRKKVINELSLDEEPTSEKNISVVVNWLVSFVKNIMAKVNDHANMIKFNQKSVDLKADQVELDNLKKKCEALELECDEVRQRGMKGNLILSSPNLRDKRSLLAVKQVTDSVSGCLRNETITEMCGRLILLKTGVTVPQSDLVACHVLKKQGNESSYIIRFGNRRPGSAWDTIAAGMLTGKNKETKANFTDANVFLNFQLTKKRGDLSREVRKAKSSKSIMKYGTDQNGRITVRVKSNSPWVAVTSVSDLLKYITTPPAPRQQQQS